MCVIIVKPADQRLTEATLRLAYDNNDDGWGILARSRDGSIAIERGFGKDALAGLLDCYRKFEDRELVIHCRIGTSGDLSIKNTHPFEVRPGLYLFHNGVLDVDCSADKSYCDSYHAAKAIGNGLGDVSLAEAFRDDAYVSALEDYAHTSRLVLASAEGVRIVNEVLGDWRDGCWFSNSSAHEPRRRFSSYLTNLTADYPQYGASYDDAETFDDPRFERESVEDASEDWFSEVVQLADDLPDLNREDLFELCQDNPWLLAEAIEHHFLLVRPAPVTAPHFTNRKDHSNGKPVAVLA